MNIKKLRKNLSLNQKDIADAIGITDKTYANYENSKTEPNIETLIKRADYFHISIDELVERKNLNTIDKGLLSQTELDIIEIMRELKPNFLEKLESYATALYSTQKDQEQITRKIKGE